MYWTDESLGRISENFGAVRRSSWRLTRLPGCSLAGIDVTLTRQDYRQAMGVASLTRRGVRTEQSRELEIKGVAKEVRLDI